MIIKGPNRHRQRTTKQLAVLLKQSREFFQENPGARWPDAYMALEPPYPTWQAYRQSMYDFKRRDRRKKKVSPPKPDRSVILQDREIMEILSDGPHTLTEVQEESSLSKFQVKVVLQRLIRKEKVLEQGDKFVKR